MQAALCCADGRGALRAGAPGLGPAQPDQARRHSGLSAEQRGDQRTAVHWDAAAPGLPPCPRRPLPVSHGLSLERLRQDAGGAEHLSRARRAGPVSIRLTCGRLQRPRRSNIGQKEGMWCPPEPNHLSAEPIIL